MAVDPTSGTLLASTDFDIATDSFAFANYGDELRDDGSVRRNLDPAQVWALYGDEVCARTEPDGSCALDAIAEVTMDILNGSMDGGHCFGMAALAWLLHSGQVDPRTLGASSASGIPSGAPVEALIARYFAAQAGDPTTSSKRTLSVADTIRALQDAWSRGDNFVLAFYDGPAHNSGHGVTPIALRQLDDGRVGIVLYDNNFPQQQTMMVTDPARDTWEYTTRADPRDSSYLFVGSPENRLNLYPVGTIAEQQVCPVCRTVGDDDSVLVLINDRSNGNATWDLEVTDAFGAPIDAVDKTDALDNANSQLIAVDTAEPVRIRLSEVPEGQRAQLDIAVLSDGWVGRVSGAELEHDEHAVLHADAGRGRLSWNSSDAGAPVVSVAGQRGDVSVRTAFTGVELDADGTVTVTSDPRTGAVTLTTDESLPSQLTVAAKRTDADRDVVAATGTPLSVAGDEGVVVHWGDWSGGGPLRLDLTAPDGSVRATVGVPLA
ncbi:hypothetical protein JL106_02825 [Nakamurella sp. YIM 132084]|uniref:Uncharacterized protein n=1 Tax=Nakamurella leprariae TaxID=2803911 RepID=A0A938Y5L9_9ACTN|nr:hypothetical protein [Nakamurella leprariae]